MNDAALIDEWHDRGISADTADIRFTEGERYTLRIEYYHSSVDALMRLEWEPLKA